MDIKKMQAFVTLCEVGNFSKAAEKLYLAQSSLSAQIKSLEDELHCRLLIRNARSLELTGNGTIFLNFCRQTISQYEDTLAQMKQSPRKIDFTIGLFYSTHLNVWCDRIARVNSEQDETIYNIRILYGSEKIESLMQREIPIGFCLRAPELEQKGFHFHHVHFDRAMICIPYTNPLSSREALAEEDIPKLKFAHISPGKTRAVFDISKSLIRRYGLDADHCVYKQSFEDLIFAMRAEGCAAILPSHLIREDMRAYPLPSSIDSQLDYGWYYEALTPQVQWVLDNLY